MPLPLALFILFLLYSLPLFLRVHRITLSVIDEEFHVPQGLHFCNGNFHVWNPKITTFPGLYMAALLLRPFGMCTVLGLRCISLIAGALNVVLFSCIRSRQLLKMKASISENYAVITLDAMTLAILPPMYFFVHVYYTDAISMTTVLLFYHFWSKGSHLHASVYAAASVLVRQTNVVWVGMLLGIQALDLLSSNLQPRSEKHVNYLQSQTWLLMYQRRHVLLSWIWQVMTHCFCYWVIVLPFIAFVFINGSIVVGDKSAHQATLHIPQLFYFSLFSLCFSPSLVCTQLRKALQKINQHRGTCLALLALMLVCIRFNTMAHPYLLADNRHYIFYIWNRFYARYYWFKYAMAPVYLLALALVQTGIESQRSSFTIMFWVATTLALCCQSLLELRYFLVPYVLWRLHNPLLQRQELHKWLWLELAFYVLLNSSTFYIFFNKEVRWVNYKEPQRIIW